MGRGAELTEDRREEAPEEEGEPPEIGARPIDSPESSEPDLGQPAREELDRFVSEHWSLLVGIATRLRGDRYDAEDVVQGILLNLCRRLARDPDEELTLGLAITAIRNRATDDHRTRKRYEALLERLHMNRAPQSMNDPTELYVTKSTLDILPPKIRCAFELCKRWHYTSKEVGEMMGLAESTVRSHIRTARAVLRAANVDDSTGGANDGSR